MGENRLKLLPKSKKAGYLSGYADPEYIEQLQQISYHFWQIPWFPCRRGFDAATSRRIIVGRYGALGRSVDGKTYILITRAKVVVQAVE
jgi:hypothetical protein